MEFFSANEYWVKAGSLMSTDPAGKFDLPDHPRSLGHQGLDRDAVPAGQRAQFRQ